MMPTGENHGIYPLPKYMRGKPNLTQAQVDLLPNHTRIWVLWSGGNGWHEHSTWFDRGITYAMTYFRSFLPLVCVGDYPLTVVLQDDAGLRQIPEEEQP